MNDMCRQQPIFLFGRSLNLNSAGSSTIMTNICVVFDSPFKYRNSTSIGTWQASLHTISHSSFSLPVKIVGVPSRRANITMLFIVHLTQQYDVKLSYTTINKATCFNPLGSYSGLQNMNHPKCVWSSYLGDPMVYSALVIKYVIKIWLKHRWRTYNRGDQVTTFIYSSPVF